MKYILEYQELDGQLRRIEKEINSSDARRSYKTVSDSLRNAEDSIKKMELRSKDLNILLSNLTKEFEATSAKATEYSDGIALCIDLQEVEYLSKKLGELSKKLFALQKECTAILAEVEDVGRKYDNFRAKYPVIKKQAEEARDAFRSLLATRQGEINAIKSQLATLEGKIDPNVLDTYRKVKNTGIPNPFVMLLDGNRCGGCQMVIPSGQVTELEKKRHMQCEHCRRIIFIEQK